MMRWLASLPPATRKMPLVNHPKVSTAAMAINHRYKYIAVSSLIGRNRSAGTLGARKNRETS